MSKPSVAAGNITNRSPWSVSVRARPDLDRSFSAGRRPDAARGEQGLREQQPQPHRIALPWRAREGLLRHRDRFI